MVIKEKFNSLLNYFYNPIFFAFIILVIFLYANFIPLPYRNGYKSMMKLNQCTELQGTILSSPVKSNSGKTYSMDLECNYVKNKKGWGNSAKGKIKIFVPSEYIEVYLPGKLFSSGTQKSIAALWEKGCFVSLEGTGKDEYFYTEKLVFANYPESKTGAIWKFRALCRLHFKRLLFQWGNAGGLFLALMCGAREYTEPVISDAFRNAGLSHILALSGMHLSLISGIMFFIGKKIGRKKIQLILQFFTILFFVWFAGFSPSLLRAFICTIFMLIATVANVNSPDMKMILCLSFILQLMISPADYVNSGFLLSYAALFGILLFSSWFNSYCQRFLPGPVSSSLSSSAAAQITTIPISLYLFNGFAPFGIIATLIVSPLVTLFIYIGIILFLFSLIIPPLSVCSGIIMNFLYTVIKYLVLFFAKLPGVEIEASRL